MKKTNAKHIIIVVLLLLILTIILLFAIGDKESEDASSMEDRTEITQEEQEEKEKKEEEEEEIKPTVVSQEKETIKGEISDFKYGVTQQPVTYNTYDIYSDGSKILVELVDDVLYNHAGYNATMEQLKAESEVNTTTYMSYYEEVLRLVNEVRAQAGVAPVTLDTALCQVAGLRAAEIEYSGVFSHKRPDGTGCFQVTEFYGITYAYLAENIAQGYRTPKAVVEAWKEDATDYSYMIDARFTKLGVGYSNVGINHEWVQVFTN